MNAISFDRINRTYFTQSLSNLERLDELNIEKSSAKFKNFGEFKRGAFMKTYKAIAKYADRQHVQLINYINSEDYKIHCEVQQQKCESKSQDKNDRDHNIGRIMINKNSILDQRHSKKVNDKTSEYLCLAVL